MRSSVTITPPDDPALLRRVLHDVLSPPIAAIEMVLGTGYVFARLVRTSARERARA